MKFNSFISVAFLTVILTGCTAPISENSLKEDVLSSYELSLKWFKNSMRSKGLFYYSYNPVKDSYSNKNNAIRQLMASRLLAELSQEDSSLLSMHKKNLEFIFKYWYKEEGDNGYIEYSDKSKLGAIGMALRTLVWSPYFSEYEKESKALAEAILSLMHSDGSFDPWYKEPSYEYNKDYMLTFYSGEAILALVEYYEKTKDSRILSAAILSQDFYIDRYVTHMKENYYPAYVPWHTQSLNKLYKITDDKKYANAIFVLNDELLKMQDKTNFVGRFYNPETPQYGTPHASSDGVYTEGLAYAYEVALLSGDTEHQKRYLDAIKIAVFNLRSLQYKGNASYSFEHPERIIGAFRIAENKVSTRVDCVQHTMDGYRKILQNNSPALGLSSAN